MKALLKALKEGLKPARFKHTEGVAKTVRKIAKWHDIDPLRAELAAWLHDCAKELPRSGMKRLLKKAKADREERLSPGLWHAPVGAWLTRKRYGVRDAEVAKAVRFHSTGAPGMTPLQKALFVADYIEPGRPHWPELPRLRRLARQDLDQAYLEVLANKIKDLLKHNRRIHPRSLAAYHDALKKDHKK